MFVVSNGATIFKVHLVREKPDHHVQENPDQRAQPGLVVGLRQVCRYLVKDFGTSQSPKSTRQRDSRYCPDR
ncbi:MAG: hypothetical protein AB2813_13915, partial [Candidatus Sedimenticola endophacoides]